MVHVFLFTVSCLAVEFYPLPFSVIAEDIYFLSNDLESSACVSLRSITNVTSPCFQFSPDPRPNFVLKRPDWTLSDHPVGGKLLINGQLSIAIQYYTKSHLRPTPMKSIFIPIRLIMRPGWSLSMGEFQCSNCTEFNLIRIQTGKHFSAIDGIFETDLKLDVSFPSAVKSDSVDFWTHFRGRIEIQSRDYLMHHNFNLTFYDNFHEIHGQNIGTVFFDADSYDAEALMLTIFFILIFYPLSLFIGFIIISIKLKKHYERVRNITDQIQQRLIEQELLATS
jgi:hypothetical protein